MAINTFSTVFESRERKFQTEKIYQGEAVDLIASITTDGVPQNLTGYSIEGYYQPVEFKGTDNDRTFYEINAEIVENKVKIHWTPDKDFGKGPYTIWALLTNGEDESYPVSWRLNLAHSPGYPASGLPEPIPQIIDFSKYTLLNAPWVRMEDAATLIEEHIAGHNTSKDAHADIRAAVATAQSTAESAVDDANRIAGTISTHINNTDNPHSVTAAQVGADPVGTAEANVIEHNTSEAAHGDIRSAVANAQQQADSALQNSIVAHNLAVEVEGNLNSHKDDKNNPHGVTELQVSTATTETANRSFIRADYNYAGRPWYIDAKVTDKLLFNAFTRVSELFVNAKIQSTYVTGWGNAGGHLVVEGAGADSDTLTLRTTGTDSTKMGNIDINPASSTKIHGDLSINARSAVTTGNYQKTASAGDLTADGTITAKTGMKVTKTDGDTTTEVMSVDSTGLTVDGKTTSTSVVSNSVGTNSLRVYATGTDTSKQYLDLGAGVIKGAHSASLTIWGNSPPTAHNISIGSASYPISLRKGSTNLLVVTTSGATFQVPIIAYKDAEFRSSISAPSFIEKDSVSIGGSNEVPDHFNYFGKFNYVIQWHNEEVMSANYVVDLFAGMDNGTVTLPEYGKTTSRYSIINCTTNTLNVAIDFGLGSHWYDIEKGIAFLIPNVGEANFNKSLNRYNVASFDVCIEKLEGVYITPNVDGTGDVTTPLQAYTVRYTALADCLNPGY